MVTAVPSRPGSRTPAAPAAPHPAAVAPPPGALELVGVAKTYANGIVALEDVDLGVGRGELVAIVGPSGCGKSTVLRLAAGLIAPSKGRISKSAGDLAYVFQDPTLLAWRSVRANVELVCRIRGIPKQERAERSARALELVGLSEVAGHLSHELSGGMKMRVSIARALATQPDLLLLDEPFGALDEFTRQRLNDELHRIWAVEGFAAVLVTHSLREAVFLGHRIVVMAPGPGRVLSTYASPAPPTGALDHQARRESPELERLALEIGRELAFVS